MTIEFTDTSPTTAKGLDQFYTAPDLAADCIDQVLSDYADQPFDTIIEPSAGTGAFSERLGSDCIALDLDPKAAEIQTADFLTWQPKTYSGRCLVIGNPPFSKSAALKFLNHAAEFAEVVVFILPATFKKKSQQNRVAGNMHLVHQHDIPARSFIHVGTVVDVPCVLQIWERGDAPRQQHKLCRRHAHFLRCAQADADLVIRRIGAYAGTIKQLGSLWSAQSNIFLRAVGCSRADLLRRFANLDLVGAAAKGVGGGSINMAEIVELYEAALTEERGTPVLKQVADKQTHEGESFPVPASDPQVRVADQASTDCARQADLARSARREKGPTGVHHSGIKSPYVSPDRVQRLTMDTNRDPSDIYDLVENLSMILKALRTCSAQKRSGRSGGSSVARGTSQALIATENTASSRPVVGINAMQSPFCCRSIKRGRWRGPDISCLETATA